VEHKHFTKITISQIEILNQIYHRLLDISKLVVIDGSLYLKSHQNKPKE